MFNDEHFMEGLVSAELSVSVRAEDSELVLLHKREHYFSISLLYHEFKSKHLGETINSADI